MPYRICKTLEIENGHMLSKHPEKCRFPHGHSRKVEIVLEADELDENDMVCDFKVFKQLIGDFLDGFDHALCMNTADPMFHTFHKMYGERVIGFAGVDPTTEIMAKAIFDRLQVSLAEYTARAQARYRVRPDVRIINVRVWETSSSWAEYFDGTAANPEAAA